MACAWTHSVQPTQLGSRGVPEASGGPDGFRGPLLACVTSDSCPTRSKNYCLTAKAVSNHKGHQTTPLLASCLHHVPILVGKSLPCPGGWHLAPCFSPASSTAPCLPGSLSISAELSFPRSGLAICVLSSVSSRANVASHLSRGDRCDRSPEGARQPALKGRKPD